MEMINQSPALVLRWLLGLELGGKLDGLTAVVTTTDGDVRYIALRNAFPPPRVLESKDAAHSQSVGTVTD
ncbi:hypothetical protein [Methyloversatilis sp.]|uniref:hypothetical protein n=1 Tax=Methyloversatilis sp. TaxID=2569862 RepID=UPI0027359175|nr:hypothetical protein [Methyloversatilis sp.]MDP2867585.1 hypothetical protein [Methyloversatilis sp.]MDP3455994.1 hypothetical protein [Methyloversatilis sp.]MDP3579792.1 hypothetical protein [Methyloversatilis sp.]